MCGSCAGGPFGCYCNGGDVFGMCPASKGFWCDVCGHYPGGLTKETYKGPYLTDILNPALLEKARAAYQAEQAKHK